MKKNALRKAVDYLMESGRISKDGDIADDLKMNKGALSTYLSGAAKPSKPFLTKFEEYYKLHLADFEGVETKNPAHGGDLEMMRELLNEKEKRIQDKDLVIRLNSRLLEEKLENIERRQKLLMDQLLRFRAKLTKEQYERLVVEVNNVAYELLTVK